MTRKDMYTGQFSSINKNDTLPRPLQFPHRTPPILGSPAGTTIEFGGGIIPYPLGITRTYSLVWE